MVQSGRSARIAATWDISGARNDSRSEMLTERFIFSDRPEKPVVQGLGNQCTAHTMRVSMGCDIPFLLNCLQAIETLKSTPKKAAPGIYESMSCGWVLPRHCPWFQ